MALTPSLRAELARSPLALGGAPLGNLYRALPDTQAIALVQRAWDAGVRYFDTAPHYGNGRSETRFGMALRNVPRDSFVLSTKVGRLLRPDAGAPPDQHGYVDVPKFVQAYDYSREGVLRSLADSQRRLRLDRIDIAYVHDLDQATHGTAFERHFRTLLDSGLPALAELKEAGIIGGYGIGVNGVAISLQTLRHADIDVILLAGRYTLADQSALPELLPECRRRDIAVVLGGPFNSGILATGAAGAHGQPPHFDYAPATANVVARVAAIDAVCHRHAIPLAAAALQFPLGHPAIALVLAGARSSAEFGTNVALMRLAIPPAFWAELRERGLIAADAPLSTSR